MSDLSIMEDGVRITDDTFLPAPAASSRAAPRLWFPSDEASPAPPPALAAKRAKRKADSPAPQAEIRERYSPTIKELPAEERPRERLRAYGAQALSTAELLAILIRTGSGQRSAVSLGEYLLSEFGSIKGVATATQEQLARVKGLGEVKAGQIKAATEFGNRLALFTEDAKPSIGGPRDVANLLMPDLRYQKKEHLTSCKVSFPNRPGANVTMAPSLRQ